MSKMVRNMARFIFACVIFGMTRSAFIETLSKCSIKDHVCQEKLMQGIIQNYAESGVPEAKIPPFDPFHVENIQISVLNLVNMTLIDGVVKGIKGCVIKKFSTDIEKGIGKQELLCDIIIKGHYKVNGASPLIESVLGGSEVHGEGNAIVKLDKLLIEFSFPFHAEKRDDGEIYLTCDANKIKYKFDILDKVTFGADKIFLGKEDVSDFIIGYLNDNWKFVMKSFGKTFFDKATEFCIKTVRNFYDNVPAKNYITEDLTPYLKN